MREVLLYAQSTFVEISQIVLRGNVTAIGGLAVEFRCRHIVFGHADSVGSLQTATIVLFRLAQFGIRSQRGRPVLSSQARGRNQYCQKRPKLPHF